MDRFYSQIKLSRHWFLCSVSDDQSSVFVCFSWFESSNETTPRQLSSVLLAFRQLHLVSPPCGARRWRAAGYPLRLTFIWFLCTHPRRSIWRAITCGWWQLTYETILNGVGRQLNISNDPGDLNINRNGLKHDKRLILSTQDESWHDVTQCNGDFTSISQIH